MTSPVLLSRYTQDLANDSRGLARFIGNLEEGRSKVSLNTSLMVGDRSDFFRFKTTSDSYVRITTGELVGDAQNQGSEAAKDGSVRYRIRSASGQVVADSDPRTGAAYEAWQKLTSSANLKLGKGTYTIEATRGTEGINSKNYIYSLTLRSNVEPITDSSAETASREFLTTETPSSTNSTYGGGGDTNVTAVLGLFTDLLA